MQRPQVNSFTRVAPRQDVSIESSTERPASASSFPLFDAPRSKSHATSFEDARIASLKVLALTLLQQVELLEKEISAPTGPPTELNLQTEVHRFEAAMIRSALAKTGGRQRRAARLLGVKVTTLNTKIKRHHISTAESEKVEKDSE